MRIAIVRLSAIGDVVHTLPALHCLRRHLPQAWICWIVEAREQEILQGHPELDALLPVNTRLVRREMRSPGGALEVGRKGRSLVGWLRACRFDVAIDFQGLIKSGLITWLTGAPIRIGFTAPHCRERANIFFTNRRLSPGSRELHVVEKNLSLLRPLGIDTSEVVFTLPEDPGSSERVTQILQSQGWTPGVPLLALNPGAGKDAKRWTPESYAMLGDHLADRLGARVVLPWGPGEETLVRQIQRRMVHPAILPPPTSIQELVAMLRRCTLVVGGDTGPIHLAAALGVPTVGLYGPTDPSRNGPWGQSHRVIQSPNGHMAAIQVDEVLDRVETLLI